MKEIDIGCSECWSPESAAAWEAIGKTPIRDRVIDESHYIVSIRECPSCNQNYLQVTTETIDWEDGEDPIYRTVLPISFEEKCNLIDANVVHKADLESIGTDRRSLKYDWPKGKPQKSYWGIGITVGVHD